VTRLSDSHACVSSDPELVVGDTVELTVRRPADEQTVKLTGVVESHLAEGGLWRGRSAALVRLSSSLPKNFLGEDPPPSTKDEETPLRRGAEPRTHRAYQPGRPPTALLSTGLGRRRRNTRKPSRGSSRPAEPRVEAQHGDTTSSTNQQPLREAALESAEISPPSALILESEVLESAELSPPSAEGLQAPTDDSLQPPPVHSTEDHIRALTDSNLDIADTEGSPSRPLPEEDAPPILLGKADIVPPADPASQAISDLADIISSPSLDSIPSVDDSSDFWDDASWTSSDELEPIDESVIPRAARIPSGVPVHFWTQAQRLGATAINFSSEGMFLAFENEAPARGAMVRVEFALGETRPDAAIRFNAEVRWHRSDRPGGNLPEGFGVQILEFETSGDQERYSKLLLYLLSIQAPEAGSSD
jgi:hypothetical protein